VFNTLENGKTDLMLEYGKNPYFDMMSTKKDIQTTFVNAWRSLVGIIYEDYLYLANEDSKAAEDHKGIIKYYITRKRDV
jgi:hypothetical protein